jgi:hypothetical protein
MSRAGQAALKQSPILRSGVFVRGIANLSVSTSL